MRIILTKPEKYICCWEYKLLVQKKKTLSASRIKVSSHMAFPKKMFSVLIFVLQKEHMCKCVFPIKYKSLFVTIKCFVKV